MRAASFLSRSTQEALALGQAADERCSLTGKNPRSVRTEDGRRVASPFGCRSGHISAFAEATLPRDGQVGEGVSECVAVIQKRIEPGSQQPEPVPQQALPIPGTRQPAAAPKKAQDRI